MVSLNWPPPVTWAGRAGIWETRNPLRRVDTKRNIQKTWSLALDLWRGQHRMVCSRCITKLMVKTEQRWSKLWLNWNSIASNSKIIYRTLIVSFALSNAMNNSLWIFSFDSLKYKFVLCRSTRFFLTSYVMLTFKLWPIKFAMKMSMLCDIIRSLLTCTSALTAGTHASEG